MEIIEKNYIQRWIPIVAATQMTKEKPEEREIKDAIKICFSMMYSTVFNNRIIDLDLYEWAENIANYISWMDEYAMEYYDDHIEYFNRLFQ
mgnify:CR=1 FL=1